MINMCWQVTSCDVRESSLAYRLQGIFGIQSTVKFTVRTFQVYGHQMFSVENTNKSPRSSDFSPMGFLRF
jgi:hypothetical protein